MKRFFIVFLIFFALQISYIISVPTLSAQDDICPAIVLTALDTTDTACQSIGRNQVCYGHSQIDYEPQEGVTRRPFAGQGDILDVVDVHALQLRPLDLENETWGVALMKIQANLPATLPGQNVTFVLFGDVAVENVGSANGRESLLTLDVTANNVNLRTGPSTEYSIHTTFSGTLQAHGRNETGTWLRMHAPDGVGYVWAAVSVVAVDGDVMALPIVDITPTYGPMQAFYFRTGIGDAPCDTAPDSGILIQTPKGRGRVNISVNGIDFSLGSTVLFANNSVPKSDLTGFSITVFDGAATYLDRTLFPGMQQMFVLNGSDYVPEGDPVNVDAAQFNYLPLNLLPDSISIAQRGQLSSNGQDIVYNFYSPSLDSIPNECVVVALHGARMDNQSWNWLVGPLQDQGWGVWVPDMPGHGQSGGPDDWSLWGSVVNDGVNFLQDVHGYECGLFTGSSIGANNAAWACAQWPTWCLGAVLFSPGTDYRGNNAAEWVASLGTTPVYIVTSTNDLAGGNASIAEQIADAGSNVMVQVYDTDLHGTDIAGEFPVWSDMMGWWQQEIGR